MDRCLRTDSGPSGNFMGKLATTETLEMRRDQGVDPS